MKKYRLLIILLFIDSALVVAHIFLRRKLGFFNLDKEGSLKAVYAGFQLLSTGGAAAICAFILGRSGARRPLYPVRNNTPPLAARVAVRVKFLRGFKYPVGISNGIYFLWSLTSASFFYLGLDDMMVVHERIGSVLNRWTGLRGYWGESFNWVIYFTPLIAAALIAYFFLIRSVWKEDRRSAGLLVTGVFFFVLGLMFEVIGGRVLGTTLYPRLIVLEEASQLVGGSFFLVGTLFFLRKKFDAVYMLRQ